MVSSSILSDHDVCDTGAWLPAVRRAREMRRRLVQVADSVHVQMYALPLDDTTWV